VSAADPRTITFSARQLQRKFKHAADFGVMEKYSRQQATMFERAIRAHVEDETTLMIPGTYRGEPVTHFVNPQTGLNVMRDTQGAFVAGWRLTLVQLANVLVRRSL
jgi:Colicin D